MKFHNAPMRFSSFFENDSVLRTDQAASALTERGVEPLDPLCARLALAHHGEVRPCAIRSPPIDTPGRILPGVTGVRRQAAAFTVDWTSISRQASSCLSI